MGTVLSSLGRPYGSFKIFHTFFGGVGGGVGGGQGFLYWGDGGSPSPTGQNLLIPPTRKVYPVDSLPPNFYSPHQRFITPQPTKFNFSTGNFSKQYHDIKNALIYKVNCNLKLPLNSMKLMCFILS